MRNGLCFDLVSHLHSLRRHVTKPALREAVAINVGLADLQLIRRRNQREYPRSSHQEARAKPCQCPNIDLLQELLLVCLQVRYYKLLCHVIVPLSSELMGRATALRRSSVIATSK